MLPENTAKLENQPINEHLPGLGQNYCVVCARHFISEHSAKVHYKTKEHKKRTKITKEVPYSHEEAERAAGLQPEKAKFTKPIYEGGISRPLMTDLTN